MVVVNWIGILFGEYEIKHDEAVLRQSFASILLQSLFFTDHEEDARMPVVENVIEKLGLPGAVSFLGYVLYLPEDHDFLAQIEHSNGGVMRIFEADPKLAKIYDNIEVVDRASDDCGQVAEPWMLFDIGGKYLAAPID